MTFVPDDEPKELVITTTFTTTMKVPVSRYPHMTAEEAQSYEEGRSKDSILTDLAEELPFIPNDDIILTRIVRIQPKTKR